MNLKFKKAIITMVSVFAIISIVVMCLSSGKAKVVYKAPVGESADKEYMGMVIWPKTESDKKAAGEAVGVAISKDGKLLYMHRGSGSFSGDSKIKEDTILVLDSNTYELLYSFGGDMFVAPHGLSVDNENNVWVTDTELNKVFKFSIEGKLLASFGSDYPTGMESALRIRNKLPKFPTFMDENTFAKPTDIANFPDGSFCVSDGYRNSRIAMFDKDGKLLWEKDKLGNAEGEFYLPHGVSKDNEGNIYVADRSNARIQIFDKDGNFKTSWNNAELIKPFGIEVFGDLIYVADGGDSLYKDSSYNISQIIVFNKKGEIVKRFGSFGELEGQLQVPHDIAVDDKGNIYVADLNNKRLQVFYIK